MARKNKKKNSNGFFFPIPLAIILFLCAVFALCDLCMKARAEALGREIKALENRRTTLRERQRKEEIDWSTLLAPASVDSALREHGLVMSFPRQEQIVRLYCPSSPPRRRPDELIKPMHYADAQKVVMND